MNAIGFLARISQLTVVLMTLGWIAVVFTAVFLPGGLHLCLHLLDWRSS